MRQVFAVAASGTVSNYINTPGERLIGLILPTLDSTTITFEFDEDGSGNGSILHINTHATATAALNLGNASTGAVVKAVPEEVGRLFAELFGRLVVASQTSGAVNIVGVFQRIGR